MSKKQVSGSLRKLDLDVLELLKDRYMDLDNTECDFSEKPLSEFMDFMLSRIDADSDNATVENMTNSVLTLNSLSSIFDGLNVLEGAAKYRSPFVYSELDEIQDLAIDKIFEIVKFEYNYDD